MSTPTRDEIVEELKHMAVEHRAWSNQRRESNKNPRAPKKWTEEEIARPMRKAHVLTTAAQIIDALPKPATQSMEID